MDMPQCPSICSPSELYSLVLKQLIKDVEQGGTLQTHDDVPDETREQLSDEEQQEILARGMESHLRIIIILHNIQTHTF